MSVSSTLVPPATGPSLAERLFVPANFIANLAKNAQLLAASILLIKAEKTALAVAVLVVANAIPTVGLSLWFGRLADRFDRRTLCLVSDVVSAVAALALPLWMLSGAPVNAGIYVTNFVLAVSAALFVPASNAMIKERVHADRLGAFNARFEISTQAAALISAAVGGFLMKAVGIEPVLYFNAVCFVVSALLFFAMGRKPAVATVEVTDAEGKTTTVVAADAGTPVRAPIVKISVLFALVLVTVTLSNVLNPVFVLETMKASEFEVGLVDAFAGIGFIVGGLFYKKIAKLGNFTIAIGAFVLCGLVTAFQASFGLVGMMALLGVGAFILCNAAIATRTLLMTSISADRVGRVFGAANAFRVAFAAVATLTLAQFADSQNVEYAFFAFGALIAGVAIIFGVLLWRTPAERRAVSW
ncbi:MFS transporter [Longispora albida]|uniref:MFS transporter n=1 Tax=Longispora albida TaxID=203523 RepID=UPI00037CB886|nr:MFS transporter [Longispora albida]